jgi:hypothetical protein
VTGAAAAAVAKTVVSKTGGPALRVGDGGVVQSSGNRFWDSGQAALVVAHDGGFIASSEDAFKRPGLAALAAMGKAHVSAQHSTVDGLANGAFCYDGAKLALTDVSIWRSEGFGIQAHTAAFLELTDVKIGKAGSVCLAVADGVVGFANRCQFSHSDGSAADFARVSSFAISDCTFCESAACGVVVRDDSPLTFTACQFDRNGRSGADVTNSVAVFSQCRFVGNRVGLYATGGSVCHLAGAIVGETASVGISAGQAEVYVNDIDASGCGEAAVAVFARGKMAIQGGYIRGNKGFAAQCHDGSLRLIKTTLGNSGPATIMALGNGCDAQLEYCPISGGNLHCEVTDGALLHLEECDIPPTESGIGLQVHRRGILQISGGINYKNTKWGLMVGAGGACRAVGATFQDSGEGGVCVKGGAFGRFEKCVIEGSGYVGIQVLDADVMLEACTIADSPYGIVIGSKSAFLEEGTVFENIERDEVLNL